MISLPDMVRQSDVIDGRIRETMFPDFLSELGREKRKDPQSDLEGQEPGEQAGPLEQALEQASLIISTAENQAEDIRQKAFDDGYQQGIESGQKAGREEAYEEHKKELQELRAKAEAMLAEYADEVTHAKEKILEEYIDDLKNISLAVGEKIVHTSLRSSSDVVKHMILNAVGKLKQTAWAKVYVAEEQGRSATEIQGDAAFLKELSRISDNVKVVLMEDAAPGTCIIELPQEVMDISVTTQLENIKEILNNARF